MKSESLPIIKSADGITLLSTWLIAIREDYDFADSVFQKTEPPSSRAYRLVLTLNHEGVHFLQGMTAAIPYSYSLNLLELCGGLMRECREGTLDADRLALNRARYKKLNRLLSMQVRDISTIDLLEAMAVVESFRATSINPASSDFVKYVETYYFARESPYRRVIDIIRTTFDDQTAFESTSRICFLSLNGDSPPNSFWTIIGELRRCEDPWRLSAIDICKRVGLDYKATLIAQHHYISEVLSTHKILAPYIEYLSKLGSLEELFEFAAQLSHWLSGGGPKGAENLVPPAVLYTGGRGKKMGLAKEWNNGQFFVFIDTAALVGACQSILTGNKCYLSCPHSECPVHITRLCHAWYAIPKDWRKCAFPTRFIVQFGKAPHELLKIGSEAPDYDHIEVSSEPFLPVIGRSTEEYRQLLNDAAQLSDPTEWDAIVISLLSEAKVNEVDHDLLDNTTYLVMSVSGYLLDMIPNLPGNPFQIWMDNHNRLPTEDDSLRIRQAADFLAREATPWFGLTLLRSLKYLLSLDVEGRPAPTWLEAKILFYAAKVEGLE